MSKKKYNNTEQLSYDNGVFEEGAGHGYRTGMTISLVLMFIGVVEIALLNSGVVKLASYPTWVQNLIILLTVIFILPGVAAFGIIWFLRSGKTRLLKESYIDLGRRDLTYHKCKSKTGQTEIHEIVFRVTNIRKIEDRKSCIIVHGQVENLTYGGKVDGLKIPKAFQNMNKIQQLARYR